MHLPQELLDKIIDYLPFYPWEYIRNCSLVAKSRVRPCQRRLFEFVWIYERNLRSWLDNISPTNVELMGHIRLLSYNVSNVTPRGEVIEPGRRLYYLRNFLPLFRQLRSFIWFSAPFRGSLGKLKYFLLFNTPSLTFACGIPMSQPTCSSLFSTASPTSQASASTASPTTLPMNRSFPFLDHPSSG